MSFQKRERLESQASSVTAVFAACTGIIAVPCLKSKSTDKTTQELSLRSSERRFSSEDVNEQHERLKKSDDLGDDSKPKDLCHLQDRCRLSIGQRGDPR